MGTESEVKTFKYFETGIWASIKKFFKVTIPNAWRRLNVKLLIFDLFKVLVPIVAAYAFPTNTIFFEILSNLLYSLGMILGVDSGIKTYRYLKG
jgi:uncharacterized membrane protein